MVETKSYIVLIVATLFLFLIYGPLASLSIALALATFIGWHFLTKKFSFMLLPKDARKGIAVLVGQRGEPLKSKTFRIMFFSSLATISIISLIFGVLGYPLETYEGLLYTFIYSWFILPFTFFVPAKSIVEESGIYFVDLKKNVSRKATIIEYLEEFIDIGAVLAFITIIAHITLDPSVVFFLLVFIFSPFYPALLAAILFEKFSYSKNLQNFIKKSNPVKANIQLELTCYNCGLRLEGREKVCPLCKTPLRT
ncbi:MAG: hypothetical protein DRJ44_05460 [Thermoprotei archaeon]|nr:MAG: hypothetical protein DRJ44_05460 [Thermoprotei archaeon]